MHQSRACQVREMSMLWILASLSWWNNSWPSLRGGSTRVSGNVLHKIAGGSIVFPAAAGAEPKVSFGRCRIATKNEKEVGTTMRTFIGPHKA